MYFLIDYLLRQDAEGNITNFYIFICRSECQDKATASPTFQTEYLNLRDVILPLTAQRYCYLL